MPRRLFKREPLPVLPPEVKVVYEPSGHAKMSEVLEDFIDPYLDGVDSGDSYRKLLTLALLAWNAALLPEDRRQSMIDETIGEGFSGASEADLAEVRAFIGAMVGRKIEHFAANQRAILSFELTDTGHDYHLSVMSTL